MSVGSSARTLPPRPRTGCTCPIGYHGRSGTVVVSATDIVRPCGQGENHPPRSPRHSARRSGSTSKPGRLRRRRAVGARRARPCGGLRRPRLRCRARQRLERPRPAGVGVRAARAVPRQVVRYVDLAVGGSDGGARIGAHGAAAPRSRTAPLSSRRAGLGAGSRSRGRVERHDRVAAAVRVDVLDGRAATRAPHRERRVAAHRGPLRLRDRVRRRARPARISFLELSRNGAEPAQLDDGTARAFLEDGDTVTIRATAPATDGGRLGFGSVTGTVRPPRSRGEQRSSPDRK